MVEDQELQLVLHVLHVQAQETVRSVRQNETEQPEALVQAPSTLHVK